MTSHQPGQPPREPDERLADWVDGRLEGEDLARFEAELEGDPELRSVAEGYRRFVESLRAGFAEDAEEVGDEPAQAEAILAALAEEGLVERNDREGAAPRAPLRRISIDGVEVEAGRRSDPGTAAPEPRSQALWWSTVAAAALLAAFGLAHWMASGSGADPRVEDATAGLDRGELDDDGSMAFRTRRLGGVEGAPGRAPESEVQDPAVALRSPRELAEGARARSTTEDRIAEESAEIAGELGIRQSLNDRSAAGEAAPTAPASDAEDIAHRFDRGSNRPDAEMRSGGRPVLSLSEPVFVLEIDPATAAQLGLQPVATVGLGGGGSEFVAGGGVPRRAGPTTPGPGGPASPGPASRGRPKGPTTGGADDAPAGAGRRKEADAEASREADPRAPSPGGGGGGLSPAAERPLEAAERLRTAVAGLDTREALRSETAATVLPVDARGLETRQLSRYLAWLGRAELGVEASETEATDEGLAPAKESLERQLEALAEASELYSYQVGDVGFRIEGPLPQVAATIRSLTARIREAGGRVEERVVPQFARVLEMPQAVAGDAGPGSTSADPDARVAKAARIPDQEESEREQPARAGLGAGDSAADADDSAALQPSWDVETVVRKRFFTAMPGQAPLRGAWLVLRVRPTPPAGAVPGQDNGDRRR